VVKQACELRGWTGPAVFHTISQAVNQKTAIGCLGPELAVSLAADTEAHDVLVIGADPLNESPMLALSLRQVQRHGGHVTVIDPRGVTLPFDFDHWAVHPSAMGDIVKALAQEIRSSDGTASSVSTAFDITKLARRLNASPRPVVVCGTDILTPREIALAADLVQALCRTHKVAGLFYTLLGANAFAAALPHDEMVSIETILDRIEGGSVRLLVVVEQDLWRDFPDRNRLQVALKQLDHMILLDYVDSPLNLTADHFIPTQPIYESGGHWINQEGRLQAASAVMAGGEPIEISGDLDHPPREFGKEIPGGEPMAAWKVVAALTGNTTSGDSGREDNRTPEQVLDAAVDTFHPAVKMPATAVAGQRIDLAAVSGAITPSPNAAASEENEAPVDRIIVLLVDWTFGTESLSAMSSALAPVTPGPLARLHPETMARLGLAEDEPIKLLTKAGSLTIPMAVDPRMARGVIVIPRHHRLEWQVLGGTRLILEYEQIKTERA
jgi:NADH-quinone oxidoreductase subunit G